MTGRDPVPCAGAREVAVVASGGEQQNPAAGFTRPIVDVVGHSRLVIDVEQHETRVNAADGVERRFAAQWENRAMACDFDETFDERADEDVIGDHEHRALAIRLVYERLIRTSIGLVVAGATGTA